MNQEFSPLNQTWTRQSSAVQGTWVPYPNDISFGPFSTEKYYNTCGTSWTQNGNITPDKSVPSNTVAKFNPIKEGYCNNISNYSSMNSAWSAKKMYTLN